MSPSASCRQWCTACVILLLVFLGWLFVVFLRMLNPPAQGVRVWCCVQRGTQCVGGYDPNVCVSNGAFAFSRDESLCAAACATPPTHALPTPQ